jgi:hypothetical protein
MRRSVRGPCCADVPMAALAAEHFVPRSGLQHQHNPMGLVPGGDQRLPRLIAGLANSAVDTLALGRRSRGTSLWTAREIAAARLLMTAFGSGAVTVIVLSWKFAELLGWGE